MIFNTILRIIWTGAAIMAGWSLAQETVAMWILVSAICCIAIAWAIVMWKLDVLATAGEAVLWLALVFLTVGFSMVMMIGDKVVSDWVVIPFFLIVIALWMIVLKFRLSLKWPLIIAGVMAVSFGMPFLGIVGLIGIGKLIIECIGRRNMFASSRIAVSTTCVSPRGLIEPKSFGMEHNNRGFGLAGLMIGVVILLIALTMAASSFYSASRLTRQASSFTKASNFAEEVIERVRLQPYASIHTTEIKTGIPKLHDTRCMANVKEREPGLKEVTVTCSWLEGTRHREVRFSTLVARGRMR